MSTDRFYKGWRPEKPHLLRGSGGLQAEVQDLRGDIESALELVALEVTESTAGAAGQLNDAVAGMEALISEVGEEAMAAIAAETAILDQKIDAENDSARSEMRGEYSALDALLQTEVEATKDYADSVASVEAKIVNERVISENEDTRREFRGENVALSFLIDSEIEDAKDYAGSVASVEAKIVNDHVDAEDAATRTELRGGDAALFALIASEIEDTKDYADNSVAAESKIINDRIGMKYEVDTINAAPTVLASITPSPYESTRLFARVVAHRLDRLEAAIYSILALIRAVPASSVLTLNSNPGAGETVTIDTTVYTFQVAPANPFDVTIGGNAQASIDNLVAAITLTGTPGVDYDAGTTKHPTVSAVKASASTMEAVALVPGVAGNAIATTDGLVDVLSVWTGATLAGGTDMSVFGTVVTTEYEDDAAWAIAIAPSGTDVDISVTGVVDTPIRWHAEIELAKLAN
jgi:ribosomal protein S20